MIEGLKFYKIRRKVDSRFSSGGLTPSFTKRGKAWTSLQALKGHLALLAEYSHYHPDYKAPSKIYADCEIVVLEVKATNTMSLSDLEEKP